MHLKPQDDLNVTAGRVRFPGSEDLGALREGVKRKRKAFLCLL